MIRRRGFPLVRLIFAILFAFGFQSPLAAGVGATDNTNYYCEYHPALCTDTVNHVNAQGFYNGHDEPSILFYSDQAGSGSSSQYKLILPTDPSIAPRQDGTGGTANFQLHPAFWVGMAMCDSQSYPEYTTTCAPASDANIFDNSDPTAADWIGFHPGAAFMEMQFYPPGWFPWPAGNSCDPVHWCAALNIDSLGQNGATGALNNSACLNSVGLETVNFAFITKNGLAQAPANPVDATAATYTPDPTRDLFMASGDSLVVDLKDTASGLQVNIVDQTTGETGSMTAGPANGFGQVVFDPNASTCTVQPYNFHPMYSSSSVHTRVPWAAHTYNIAFSDEIGHWEYCASSPGPTASCTTGGASDGGNVDADDNYCFGPPYLPTRAYQIGGCMGIPTSSTAPPFDNDWDGVPYGLNWPGTMASPSDYAYHGQPIRFTSPKFLGNQSYSQVGFETDLPGIEGSSATNPCDVTTGINCTNPPMGAAFYPLYTTTMRGGQCYWQLGGTKIPGTLTTFGGSSTTEYGPLASVNYQNGAGSVSVFEDYRQVLPTNLC